MSAIATLKSLARRMLSRPTVRTTKSHQRFRPLSGTAFQLEDRVTPSGSNFIDILFGSSQLINKGNSTPLANTSVLVEATATTLSVQLNGVVPSFATPGNNDLKIGLDDDGMPFLDPNANIAAVLGNNAQTNISIAGVSSINLPSATGNNETTENAITNQFPAGRYELKLEGRPSTTVFTAPSTTNFSLADNTLPGNFKEFPYVAVHFDGTVAGTSTNRSIVGLTQVLSQTLAIDIDKVTVDGSTSGDGLTILTGEEIKWRYTVTNPGTLPLSNVTVTDSMGVTPVYVSGDANNNGMLDTNEVWIYETDGTAITGDYSNTGYATGSWTGINTYTVCDDDDSSYFGAEPQVAISKVTVDGATSGDGLTILSGESIVWRYTVTNAGNVALAIVTVADNQAGVTPAYVSGDANDNDLLDLTETWVFEASGTAVVGSYSNTGTASGSFTDDAGHTRTDTASDDSSYFGANPQIAISKLTNGTDDCPTITAGAPVMWTYTVTNTGNVALTMNANKDLIVADDHGTTPAPIADDFWANYVGGDDNGNGLLDLTETWEFVYHGTAILGPYLNTASVSGTFTDSAGHTRTATATDTSCYFGDDEGGGSGDPDPGDFRTQTMGGWGAEPHGNNPGTYLHANFSAAFLSGITIDATKYYEDGFGTQAVYTFLTAQSITDFLPAGGQLNVIGQLLALKLSVGFDFYDVNFGADAQNLANLVVADTDSPVYGESVANIILYTEQQLKTGTNAGSYSLADLAEALAKCNENFVDGVFVGGYLTYPA